MGRCRRLSATAFFLGLLAIFATRGLSADEAAKPTKATDDDYELFLMFVDTLDQVERNYVKDISRRELIDAAMQGVLNKLDPYSNYIKPDEIGYFKSSVESQFGGIGIRIDLDRQTRGLKIVTPMIGSPAYRAGIEAGDMIQEIDGKTTRTITKVDDAIKLLKGDPGSKVTLKVLHARTRETETVDLVREIVHVETVMGDRRKDDDSWDFMFDHEKKIGYIRLTSFSRETTQELANALKVLEGDGLKGLVIDLRFNPGGLLSTAIETCDLFVASGRIVSTKGRNTPEKVWDAKKEGTHEGYPMAVLVNGSSASASEIFSACLQDNGRAKVIGERTYGKGSVQNVIDLEGGKSALKLTTASYHRPNGKNIHKAPDAKDTDEWGVSPDEGFAVALSREQTMQLQQIRSDRDILIPHPKPTEGKPSVTPAGGDTTTETSASEPKPATETKPEADPKPAADQKPTEEARPSDEATPAADPAPADKPAAEPAAEPDARPGRGRGGAGPPAARAPRRPFVDTQLQKALEYLGEEIAKGAK